MSEILQLAELLSRRSSNDAYAATKRLMEISEASSEAYSYFDIFAALLHAKSPLARNRGLYLVAANAKWDHQKKLDRVFDEYLSLLHDEKPITVRECVRTLPVIAAARPDLAGRIREELKDADLFSYADTMRPLILGSIVDSLRQIDNMYPE